jgi:hypothetical protein
VTAAGFDPQAPAVERQLERRALELRVLAAAVRLAMDPHLADNYDELIEEVDRMVAYDAASRALPGAAAGPSAGRPSPAGGAAESALRQAQDEGQRTDVRLAVDGDRPAAGRCPACGWFLAATRKRR